MKFVALALLAAVGFAGVLSTHEARNARLQAHFASVFGGVQLRVDDEPPPVDCPMCGGNPALHLKTMRKMLTLQSQLVLAAAMAR